MASMYLNDRIINPLFSSEKLNLQFPKQAHPVWNNGYTSGDLFLNSGGGGYSNIMPQVWDVVEGVLLGTGSDTLNQNSNNQSPWYQPSYKKVGY